MRGWVFGGMLGLGVLAAGAASAQPVNIAGTWEVAGQMTAGGVVYAANPTCRFEQVGERISGACIGPNATGPATGVVSGRTISWSWTHRATTLAGISGVTNFNGAYGDRHLIRGEMSAPGIPGVGSFTQTR
jgi:hypothetical protein